MSITDATVVFPNNVLDLLAFRVKMLDEDLVNSVFKRPLRSSDPVVAVGLMPMQWDPNIDSIEIGGRNSMPPPLSTYTFGVQAYVKDMDEERGLAKHSVLSKMISTMLYRDDILRVGLQALATELNGVRERTKRWGVRRQAFVSNEISGSFMFLSTIEFWLETETM